MLNTYCGVLLNRSQEIAGAVGERAFDVVFSNDFFSLLETSLE